MERQIDHLRERYERWKAGHKALYRAVTSAITHSTDNNILYAYNLALMEINWRTHCLLGLSNGEVTKSVPYLSRWQIRSRIMKVLRKSQLFPWCAIKCFFDRRLLEDALIAWLLLSDNTVQGSLITQVIAISGTSYRSRGLMQDRVAAFQREVINNSIFLGYEIGYWHEPRKRVELSLTQEEVGEIYKRTLPMVP